MIALACGDLILQPIVGEPASTVVAPRGGAGGLGGALLGEEPELPSRRFLVAAEGIEFERVELNQGLAHVFFQLDEELPEDQPPVVSGRPGLLRVFFRLSPSFSNREIRARLVIQSADRSQTMDDIRFIDGPPVTDRIDGTFRFFLDGVDIQPDSEFRLSLYEKEPAPMRTSESPPSVPEEGTIALLAVEPHPQLEVTLVPVRTLEGIPASLPSNHEVIEQALWDRFPIESLVVRTGPTVLTSGVRDDWLQFGCEGRAEDDSSLFVVVGPMDGLAGNMSGPLYDEGNGCVAIPLPENAAWDGPEIAQVVETVRRLLGFSSTCEEVVVPGYSLSRATLLEKSAFFDSSCVRASAWVSKGNWHQMLPSP